MLDFTLIFYCKCTHTKMDDLNFYNENLPLIVVIFKISNKICYKKKDTIIQSYDFRFPV